MLGWRGWGSGREWWSGVGYGLMGYSSFVSGGINTAIIL